MVKITLNIEGMMCGMCESHINDAIRNAFPVKKVTSSYKKEQTVILSEQEIAEDDLRNVIEKCGYTLWSVTQRRVAGFGSWLSAFYIAQNYIIYKIYMKNPKI